MLGKEKPFLPKKQFLKNQFVDCEFVKESLNTLTWAWVSLWLLQSDDWMKHLLCENSHLFHIDGQGKLLLRSYVPLKCKESKKKLKLSISLMM